MFCTHVQGQIGFRLRALPGRNASINNIVNWLGKLSKGLRAQWVNVWGEKNNLKKAAKWGLKGTDAKWWHSRSLLGAVSLESSTNSHLTYYSSGDSALILKTAGGGERGGGHCSMAETHI